LVDKNYRPAKIAKVIFKRRTWTMSNTILNTPNNISQLLGNPTGKNSANDLTGILNAQQQAGQNAKGIQEKYTTPRDQFSPSAKGMQAAAMSEKYQNAYAYSQTMSLEMTTQEGDKVKVDFRQLYAMYQQYQHQQGQAQSGSSNKEGANGPQGVRQFDSTSAMQSRAFEEKFAISVEGNLNKKELKAVIDVFKQVDTLSKNFFNGNIEKAFKKAKDMHIDFGQLKNVSLNIQKTEAKATSYQQAAAYQNIQQQPNTQPAVSGKEVAGEKEGDKDSDDTQANIANIPQYLQNWQAAIHSLDEQFKNARKNFDQMMSGSLAQRFPDQGPPSSWYDRVKGFHDELAQMAHLNKTTLHPSGVEIDTVVNPAKPSQETTTSSTKAPTA
jgi:hypothetical protein